MVIASVIGAFKRRIPTNLKVNARAYCPGCSDDLTDKIHEAQKRNITSIEVGVVCDCKTYSLWNTGGFPPILIDAAEIARRKGEGSRYRDKYGK